MVCSIIMSQPLLISASPPRPLAEPAATKFDIRAFVLRRIWFTAMFLTWYVLSIGPMFWSWHHAQLQNEPSFVEFFYRPLAYACSIPIVADIVNAYINLWIL